MSGKFLALLVLMLALGMPQASKNLQAASESTIGGAFSAQLSPKNPDPQSTFTVTLSSLTDDLSRAVITWTVNGKQLAKATGQDTLEIQAGEVGKKTVISIVINTVIGGTIQKTITLIPADLDLVWEADTVAPNLYRGKRLPSPESTIRLVGTLEGKDAAGKTLLEKDVLFTWSQDGKQLSNLSGAGKSRISLEVPGAGEETTITLVATSADGSVVAEKSVAIPIVKPFVLLYEDRPLEGISPVALGDTLFLVSDEVSLSAEPYFFSKPGSALSYTWRLNNGPLATSRINPGLITLRLGEGGGKSQIALGVQNSSKIFQQALVRLAVLFNRTGETK